MKNPFELSQLGKLIKKNEKPMRTFVMCDKYDFSNSVKNPYIKKLKKQVTIGLMKTQFLILKT